jgi:hypothetical protein
MQAEMREYQDKVKVNNVEWLMCSVPELPFSLLCSEVSG